MNAIETPEQLQAQLIRHNKACKGGAHSFMLVSSATHVEGADTYQCGSCGTRKWIATDGTLIGVSRGQR